MDSTNGKPPEQISYRLEGKLNSAGLGATRFDSHGELALPGIAQ